MIPRVARAGRSFKGAARYYLHDKQADTNERVAFIETVNLPTDDAHRATAHMIDTATHAAELKQAAGIKGGRKMQFPVYCYSLAWHPSETPTREEQIQAAHDTLKTLGIDDRQALIVGHRDTDHPHVHVIVNKVCPDTGRSAVMSNDQVSLSRWAEKYEQQRGQVFCKDRVENNKARKRGEWRKDDSLSRRQHYEWKKQESDKLWSDYRADRDAASASRRGQYDALWQQKQDRFAARKAENKQLYKPIWRDVFQRQRKELKTYDTSLSKRIGFALSQKDRGKLMGVVRAFTADQGQRRDFLDMQAQERAQISEKQSQSIRDAGREVTKAWRYDRDQLKAMHKEQDAARLDHYKGMSDKLWEKGQGDAAKQDFDRSTEPKKARDPENQKRRSARDIMQEQRERSRKRPRRPRR
ncbi:NikB-like protein [Sulfitobacter donghicola DSW-25 = KCTC 12864 = JCM 14565]|uniref:relaxase/mobilization nuclease domain-containing protein n=2 Tax=Sulfitobacter donghicola TaxID=421000 RepID=UPI00046AAAE1|nr:relaxase/mobilization nuclease domain-containing protein [Sulfitobacter donghicola]KIN65236.1 NikB-like protein [Sulfitobacter donghicola DSW-25 = KCTC 12864 = JCM 14565]